VRVIRKKSSMADHAPTTNPGQENVPRERRAFPWRIGTRRAGLLMAGALVLTGIVFAWQAALLDLGQVGLPGPGFFPLALALLLVIFSAAIALEGWLSSTKETAKDERLEFGHPQVLITFAALLAVPILFEPLGALIALGLLTAVLLVLIARVSPLLAIVWSALGMAASWYLFEELLGVRLPTGPF
jgi:putative tricarboxylic transport membrane protein